MRILPVVLALGLAACSKETEQSAAGNQQAVIDKANADVMAAEAAAATGPDPAETPAQAAP